MQVGAGTDAEQPEPIFSVSGLECQNERVKTNYMDKCRFNEDGGVKIGDLLNVCHLPMTVRQRSAVAMSESYIPTR